MAIDQKIHAKNLDDPNKTACKIYSSAVSDDHSMVNCKICLSVINGNKYKKKKEKLASADQQTDNNNEKKKLQSNPESDIPQSCPVCGLSIDVIMPMRKVALYYCGTEWSKEQGLVGPCNSENDDKSKQVIYQPIIIKH